MEMQTIIGELGTAAGVIPEAAIARTIEKIEHHARIFVYGTGRSGLMLKALAMRLMQIGRTAYVVGETTTPSIAAGDLLIAASASGTTVSVCQTAESARAQGADLLILTAEPEAKLAQIATPDIIIPSATKHSTSAASVQPLGSLFEQMLLIVFDSIILRMNRAQNGANEAMAARHASLE